MFLSRRWHAVSCSVPSLAGLGHLAVQISAALGFETLAATSSADKTAEATGFGADESCDS